MKCRCCGAELEQYTQPGYAAAGVPDRDYVTCPTSETACPLGRQTLDAALYPTKDLTPYLASFERRKVAVV